MADSLAGVVLAAGAGTRLLPLTRLRPKALCPVANVALVDLALARARRATADVAVNVHHGRAMLEEHLGGRVHLSVEKDRALGTAGALGHLRDWIAGRPVLVVNSDAWLQADVAPFVGGWDGARTRLLVVNDPPRGDFGPWRHAGVALMPWSEVEGLPDEPAGLYEARWRPAHEEDRLDLVTHEGPFFDCGTARDYLAANLAASGGASVIGPGALVEGEVVRTVVWPGAVVTRREHLVDAVRAHEFLTVLVR